MYLPKYNKVLFTLIALVEHFNCHRCTYTDIYICDTIQTHVCTLNTELGLSCHLPDLHQYLHPTAGHTPCLRVKGKCC